MDDQELFDIMQGRALIANINRILDEETPEDRRKREEERRKPCTFTGGGDADEDSDETIW